MKLLQVNRPALQVGHLQCGQRHLLGLPVCEPLACPAPQQQPNQRTCQHRRPQRALPAQPPQRPGKSSANNDGQVVPAIGNLQHAPGSLAIEAEMRCDKGQPATQQANQQHVQHHTSGGRSNLTRLTTRPDPRNGHRQQQENQDQHHRHRHRPNTRHPLTRSRLHRPAWSKRRARDASTTL
ncbi:hypothetical protein D3C73_923940 [compost metagenome]